MTADRRAPHAPLRIVRKIRWCRLALSAAWGPLDSTGHEDVLGGFQCGGQSQSCPRATGRLATIKSNQSEVCGKLAGQAVGPSPTLSILSFFSLWRFLPDFVCFCLLSFWSMSDLFFLNLVAVWGRTTTADTSTLNTVGGT